MKLSQYPTYRDNPSKTLEKIQGITIRDIFEDGEIMETTTKDGEVLYLKSLGSAKTVKHDSLQYKKVYTQSFPTIGTFSTPTLKIWCFIMSTLAPKKDEININMSDCKEYTGYLSEVPIYKGILELLEKEFIYRKVGTTSSFFIDINKYFNGKRI